MSRTFHSSSPYSKSQPIPPEFLQDHDRKKDKSLVVQNDLFDEVAKNIKTKATFNKVVEVFTKRDVRRRGHVEFIYAALKKMPEFGVERDITVYNKLLDVFPKEVFVPRNFIQRMFNHYPRQQECGVQVLEQMENYGRFAYCCGYGTVLGIITPSYYFVLLYFYFLDVKCWIQPK